MTMSRLLQLTIGLSAVAVIALSATAFFLGKEVVTSMAAVAFVAIVAVNWLLNG